MKLKSNYDADLEELDLEELDSEEEERTVKPATAILISLGLIVSAALICAVLWNVTHNDKKDNGTGNSQVKNTEGSMPEREGNWANGSGTVPEGDGGMGSGAAPEGNSGMDLGTAPEEDGDSGLGTAPGGDGNSEMEELPEEDGDSGLGTAPGGDGNSEMEELPEGSGNSGIGTAPGGDGNSEMEELPEGSGNSDLGTAPGEAEDSGSAEQGTKATMAFTDCGDTVTPKEVINLRSAPSTAEAENIVSQAVNGELLFRTGINNDTGWSRLEYNGQTLYAVSRYLTVDLAYQPPVADTDANSVSTKDGRTITFTDCDDNISPKMYVNLRLEPSTSAGNDTVHCRLEYGEIVHRTGVSEDSGWSRVEYDGVVLYVVTSYMYVVEESQ